MPLEDTISLSRAAKNRSRHASLSLPHGQVVCFLLLIADNSALLTSTIIKEYKSENETCNSWALRSLLSYIFFVADYSKNALNVKIASSMIPQTVTYNRFQRL